jgi:hypothetical protein
MVIIDPERNGCTIWYNGNYQHIHGNVVECAERIMKSFSDEKGQFYFDIYLDIMGIGCAYVEEFTRNNFKFHQVGRHCIIK